jgi:Glycosyl Hydrolase Family 88
MLADNFSLFYPHNSWEIGTRAEALLELDSPSYAVFSPDTLPPPQIIPDSVSSLIQPVLDIASSIVYNRSLSNNNNNNASGPQPLMQDGSAGDLASIGVAVLLANWTGQGYYDNLDFARAATDQLDFLYQSVPRTSDGAISHRVSEVQLWCVFFIKKNTGLMHKYAMITAIVNHWGRSDFVYMVPPFLAYYGVVTRDRSKLVDAYNQIRLYRNYLRDTNASNLWKHVLLGSSGIDDGHWSTGAFPLSFGVP